MIRAIQNDTNRYGWSARRQYRRMRDAAMGEARAMLPELAETAEGARERSEAVRYARRMNHYVVASLRG